MDPNALHERIGQWENMTQQDPANAMGWFSLGSAYKDAERDGDAARALRKCIELDETYSRAYQLLGQLLIKGEANDQAGEILTKGYTVAAERGDVMPMRAMGSLLEKIDKPVPETAAVEVEQDLTGDQILDRHTGKPGPKLPDPPLKGPLGQFIFDHFSAPTWRQWIGQGTKVINELRLDFSNPDHQNVYDLHMMEYLGFTQEEVDAYAKRSDDAG